LEIRFFDAMPWEWLEVAVSLIAALTADATATRLALEAVAPAARPGREAWCRAAQRGMTDPDLRAAATALFDIALEAAPRLPRGYLPDGAAARLAAYGERFPAAGRCPADELLEHHRADPDNVTPWLV
ncbi:MAG: ergothioneine biosynthesis glutamate--cysteine ligase EgtA, partial [Candidatus Dormibacteria bacterium]